ncbi:proteasome subunit beta type-6 [Hydra vulgaris]|uniref:Proteasome subunit beta n=1 Tax=Hydra vulgaris TaxID=6087 RepID=T2MGV4_HYDVU|nr:proteasome subunit beta type-6 [Hydra vulgaris]
MAVKLGSSWKSFSNGINIDSDLYPDWLNSEIKTGTTIMAVEFDGGVVVGADSRTTSGSYVANRVTDKLTPVTDNIFCCRSGSAADTQAIADQVRYELDMHMAESGRQALVKTAANLFRNVCYERRDSASAGIIVAGWDEREGGQVYSVPIGGMCLRQPFSIGGSGSTYIYGHCDSTFVKGMSKDECIKFVTNAVALAIFRDGSSGGCIRLAIINKDGVERKVILGNEIPTFWQG